MRLAIVAAKFTAGRSQWAEPRHGDLPPCRHHRHTFEQKFVDRMVARGYDRKFAQSLLRADQGLRFLRLSRKPCRQLCPAGLCFGLDQETSPGRLRRRPAQFPAHGFLRARRDRALCPRTWRDRAWTRCRLQRLGLHAGTQRKGRAMPVGWGCARSTALPKATPAS